MNYNHQNRANKRRSDDFDTTSNQVKKFKTEYDVKVSESANDRLKRLRNSLANSQLDLKDTVPLGWKPPALSAMQAVQVNKPQVLAKRQYLHASRKIVASNLSPEKSPSEKKIQEGFNGRSHISTSKNITNDSLNRRQHSSIGDRLKLSKSTSPYSVALSLKRNNLLSAINYSDNRQDELGRNDGPIQNVRPTFTKSLISNATCVESFDNHKYGLKPCIKSSVGDRLQRPNKCDAKFTSTVVGITGILDDSNSDETTFESCDISEHSIVDTRVNIPKVNLVENNNILGNFTSTEGSNIGVDQNQRLRKPSDRMNLSQNYFQNLDAKYSKNAITNNASIFDSATKKNIHLKDSQNQVRTSTEVQRVLTPKISKTPSFNNSIFNENASTVVSKKVNPNANEFRERPSIFHSTSSIVTANSTNQPNNSPKKISVQDRLKCLAPSLNKNVDKRPNNTSKINAPPNDIFNSIRTADEMESEAMEWSDIDMAEVVENVEKMRKGRKYTAETETELQYMLNANNTFAEKYQNPQEDNTERDYYIVVDTNVFLSTLSIIKEILSINLRDNKQLYVYIPWMVIQELDHFKDGRCSTNKLQLNARKAITLLNECLGVKGSHVKAQLVTDALEAKSISKEPDDLILACCLQAKERNHIVLLLSNDTNLRNKAIINNLSAYSTDDILDKLKSNKDKSGLQINDEQIELRTSILLSVVIDESLREAYGDIFDQMTIKKPPYTLFDALELMRKYWISVFSGILQKQCLNTIDKLYDLMRQKSYTGLPESDDKEKFVHLTLALCVFLKTSFSQHTDNINTLVKYIKNMTRR